MLTTVSRRALLSGAGGLTAAAILRRPADAAEFSYKFVSVLPADHPMTLRSREAVAKIKEESGGRLDITVYPNSVLGTDTAMLAQCVSGAVEMYALSGDLLAPRIPVTGITGVGFAFPGYDQVWAAMDGELGDFLRAQSEKSNMHCLKRTWDHGFRQITTRNKPINSPADLKGFKIRLPVSPLPIALFKHLGAAPTAINFSEVYSALQTGVVDGQENPLIVIDVAKLYEVQKYCSLTNHQWAGYHVAFNMKAWKRLPPDLQALAERVFDAAALQERQDWTQDNKTVIAKLKGKGLIVNQPEPGPFRDKLRQTGFYPEMKRRMGEPGWSLLEKYVGKLA
ncbi:MAG: TRAP transporter substrate-binding protein [Pseudomonadota bacterium]|nr:TRAP transporter substrate-binding protein [Pseudomonadota bacterium]